MNRTGTYAGYVWDGLASAPRVLDELRCLLGNHDDGRDGVAVGLCREHGRVGHAQATDVVDTQLGVDDGSRIGCRAHLARASVVVLAARVVPDQAPPVRVGGERVFVAVVDGRPVNGGAQLLQGLGVHQVVGQPQAPHQHVDVLLCGQVIGIDPGPDERIGASQPDGAPAPWPHVHRPHIHAHQVRGRLARAVHRLGVSAVRREAVEEKLHVSRVRGPCPVGSQKRGHLEAAGRGQRTGPMLHVLADRLVRQHPVVRHVQLKAQPASNVVLQIVAHPQVLHHRHAQRSQILCRPDAGQHE